MLHAKKAMGVIRLLIKRYFQDQVGRSAAELAYYLLFSLFPLLIFINAAISMLHLSPQALSSAVENLLPPQAAQLLTAYLRYIQDLDTPLLLYACLFLTVYALSRASTSLLRALSGAYRLPRRNRTNLITGVLLSIILLVSLVMLMLVLVVSENVLLQVNRFFALPELLLRLWNLLRVMVVPAYMLIVLSCFYATVGRRRYAFRHALSGAFFAVILGFGVSTAFSYYINHATRYSLLYGSLTAFMVLMLWLYLISAVIVLGGELNVILANHTDLLDKGE